MAARPNLGVALRRVLIALNLILTLAGGPPAPASAQAPFPTDFSDWHLPLPAGEWVISRTPCGVGLFQHQGAYYEDECALDLTPLAGSMAHVPVLAPYDGQVFFMGTRADSGLALMLQHPDGRVSAMLHLSKIVVAPDQAVRQGQVIAYAGNTGSSGRAHLHFHVQPNTVERVCLPLNTLDEIDFEKTIAISHNLAWSDLTLVEPPPGLPAWLAAPEVGGAAAPSLPAGLALSPRAQAEVPLAVPAALLADAEVHYLGRRLQPVFTGTTYSLFTIPIVAPPHLGQSERLIRLRDRAGTARSVTLRLPLTVQPAAETRAGADIVYISPTFVSPANYSAHAASPRLCWREPVSAGTPPLSFRAMVAGPQLAESGWITADCWQLPPLPKGTYFWKVFVRDGLGLMNRTNQRPFVFRIK